MTGQEELAALKRDIASSVRLDISLAEARKDYDGFGGAAAADVVLRADRLGGIAAEWTLTPAASPDHVILYLHGGGFSVGSIASHRPMVAELGRLAGVGTVAIEYRLAPEHPFPAQNDDALAAYRALLEQVPANRIALAGDSAGANLALTTLIAIRAAGLPLPAAAYCQSPWVDMDVLGETMALNAGKDPLVDRANALGAIAIYLAGADPRDPRAAPLHADLAGLPPLLIQAGTDETLLDDALAIARRAAIADVDVTLTCWPHMVHNWQIFWQRLTAGHRALAEGAAFLVRHLKPSD